MASFNKVILAGNLTRDPEMRYTQSGTAVVGVGIAVNERFKNSAGDSVENVNFFELTFWGRQAEICAEYCKKGSPILVEGRLKLETWEKDGTRGSKVSVVVEKFQLLGTKNGNGNGNGNGGGSTATKEPADGPVNSGGGDIPF